MHLQQELDLIDFKWKLLQNMYKLPEGAVWTEIEPVSDGFTVVYVTPKTSGYHRGSFKIGITEIYNLTER
jgi:hypothetical protein